VLETFGFIGLYMIVAIGFAVVMILLPIIFRYFKAIPQHSTEIKTKPFECGMDPIGPAWVQFNIRYYFYALLFVALDVLVIFIYPWAVELRNLGFSAWVGILVFVAIVLVGYIYAWKKRALEWK
jgi:NADH-quinone oxidoreductase subunit A